MESGKMLKTRSSLSGQEQFMAAPKKSGERLPRRAASGMTLLYAP
jgi:hypothetical protein